MHVDDKSMTAKSETKAVHHVAAAGGGPTTSTSSTSAPASITKPSSTSSAMRFDTSTSTTSTIHIPVFLFSLSSRHPMLIDSFYQAKVTQNKQFLFCLITSRFCGKGNERYGDRCSNRFQHNNSIQLQRFIIILFTSPLENFP